MEKGCNVLNRPNKMLTVRLHSRHLRRSDVRAAQNGGHIT